MAAVDDIYNIGCCCCRSLEGLVRCFTDVTNASCGDKAARWVSSYKSLLLSPVKWKIFVPLSSEHPLLGH